MLNRLAMFLLTAALAVAPSCKAISSLIHDGEVVAKFGDHKLYRSELEEVIPNGTSPEDSVNLANAYINSWAKDKAFVDIAQQQLTKEEKDVSKELEAYRQSLLRYRYEQRYINERLDTTVSSKQIEDYYGSHSESFKLERPIMKARFLNISKDSPNLAKIKKLMSSDDVADVIAADSVAFNSAFRYRDFSSAWIDAVKLAAEFGVDYVQMLSAREGQFIQMPDGEDKISVAYIVDSRKAGEIAPVEYCSDRIKDIIISGRKHELLAGLERDLMEDARLKENFVIYSK
mgnify:FL=1